MQKIEKIGLNLKGLVDNTLKIMLINIDSKIPNLALKKIEKYYLDRGDEIINNCSENPTFQCWG